MSPRGDAKSGVNLRQETASDVSARMKRVKGRDTGPEMAVRRICHKLGYRYRLHRKDLPGTPDLTFPGLRKVIFVHGCFWHRHGGKCSRTTMPRTNLLFWEDKFRKNIARDKRTTSKLRHLGWRVAVIWECEIFDEKWLEKRLRHFLEK